MTRRKEFKRRGYAGKNRSVVMMDVFGSPHAPEKRVENGIEKFDSIDDLVYGNM